MEYIEIGKDAEEIEFRFGTETYKLKRVSTTGNVYTYKTVGLPKYKDNDPANGEWVYTVSEIPLPGYQSPKYSLNGTSYPASTEITAHDGDAVKIVNDEVMAELPSTGGSTTKLYTVFGLSLVVGAGAALALTRRRKAR